VTATLKCTCAHVHTAIHMHITWAVACLHTLAHSLHSHNTRALTQMHGESRNKAKIRVVGKYKERVAVCVYERRGRAADIEAQQA
jgi:hypothetical protein